MSLRAAINATATLSGPGAFPEWRWKRASEALANRKRSPCFEKDEGVIAAMEFMDDMGRCFDQYDWERLNERLPDQYMAMTFWVDPDSMTTRTREDERPSIFQLRRHAALEAYLLSKLRHDEIAGRMGMTAEAVAIYETWFFDFRSHANSTVWITTKGVRGDVAGSNTCSFENVLRLHGWKYGPQRVDDLLTGTGFDDNLRKSLRDEMLDHLLKSSAISARNVYHQGVLFEATRGMLETSDRLREAEIAAGKDFRSQSEKNYIEQIEAEMKGHSWCMLQVPDPVAKQTPAKEHRIAVQLGYDKDYSQLNSPNVTPSAPA
jgi:hypothetical protein